MIYDADDLSLPRGILYNADTGEQIPLVYRFDDETGDYWHYVPDTNGHPQLDPNDSREILRGHGQCHLKFVPFGKDEEVMIADEPAIIEPK